MEEPKSRCCLPELRSATAAFAGTRVQAGPALDRRLILPLTLCLRVWSGLVARSDGHRESAAILLGRSDGSDDFALDAVFHHDLDDDRGEALYVELTELGKTRLYDRLAAQAQRIVALVHTHPGNWVGLSEVDRENQICSRVGVWSIVLPNYAAGPMKMPASWGIHARLSKGWSTVQSKDVAQHIVIEGGHDGWP